MARLGASRMPLPIQRMSCDASCPVMLLQPPTGADCALTEPIETITTNATVTHFGTFIPWSC